MNRGIYPILSGALVQERRLQVLSNNIANVNTTGFKRDEPLFQAILGKVIGGMPSGSVANGVMAPPSGPPSSAQRVFASMRGLQTIFEAGRIRGTGNLTDMAIQGPGFFEIKTPAGARYTRDGNFHLDGQRRIVTEQGFPVMGLKGELKLPVGDPAISPDGKVFVGESEVGGIKVVEFADLTTIKKVGDGFLLGEKPTVSKNATVLQGHIEESTVESVKEMVRMIEVMRSYEAAQKVMQTMDKMTETAIQDLGRVA